MDGFYFHHHLQPFSHPLTIQDKIIKGECYVASHRRQSKQLPALHFGCLVLFPNKTQYMLHSDRQANDQPWTETSKKGQCNERDFIPLEIIIISTYNSQPPHEFGSPTTTAV